MTPSFGSIVIRFICPDLDPVVQVRISEPSSQGGFDRLGPFLVLSYISGNQATSNWQWSDQNREISFSCLSCLQSPTRHANYHFWILARFDKESLAK